jgi:catechol 2,3-dioxygenase-like lactoylglutathione lyase family enzyme
MGLKDSRVGVLMAVSDLERARRFYEYQLGLVPGERSKPRPCFQCTRHSA